MISYRITIYLELCLHGILHGIHALLPKVGLAQLLQASLARRALGRQVLGVARRLAARDVVEVRGAALEFKRLMGLIKKQRS